jgi:hypothetical protein
MKILITIMSCHRYAFRRKACRDTWLKHLLPDMEYFFMVGRGDGPLEPDVVKLDADDGYGALWKGHAGTVHAVNHFKFDWLFRVDDDTFAVPSRLPSLIKSFGSSAEMIGADWTAEHTWGTGGAGLLFSRRVVEYQATHGVWTGCTDGDDGWMCACAREIGAGYHWSGRLKHHRHLRVWPAPENDIVTCHYATPEDMEELQAKFDRCPK